MAFTVLILGGYGNFGSKIAGRLAGDAAVELLIAGRNINKARSFSEQLEKLSGKKCKPLLLDTANTNFSQVLADSGAQLLIHTSGPFQSQNYCVAETCIKNGIHYIDLADGRSFVNNFSELNELAKNNGVLAISGVSSVPGLSSAVIHEYLDNFSIFETLEYGISPGNKAERGEATVAAILSYTGHTFQRLENSFPKNVYGWQNIFQHQFPEPMRKRWLANCDIPDLSLFPKHYPTLKTIRFYAGLELPILHLAMWGMSWIARVGIIKNWARYASPITHLSRWFECFGSDIGGMFMKLTGKDHAGKSLTIEWNLVAKKGDGPMIPTIPAVILAKKLAHNQLHITGAIPCIECFTLKDFFDEVKDLAIYQTMEKYNQ